jgi:hypothetical protein
VWSSAKASVLTGLTNLLVFVVAVSNFPNGRFASGVNHSHFTGWKSQGHVVAFLRHHLSGCASSADHLATLRWLEFNVVNKSTKWDILEHQAVTWKDVSTFAGANDHAISQTLWSQDVGLYAIFVLQKSNAAGSVWIVFDTNNRCVLTILDSLEINDAVASLVTTRLIEGGSATVVVDTTGLWERSKKALFGFLLGDLLVIGDDHVPSARRGWF